MESVKEIITVVIGLGAAFGFFKVFGFCREFLLTKIENKREAKGKEGTALWQRIIVNVLCAIIALFAVSCIIAIVSEILNHFA